MRLECLVCFDALETAKDVYAAPCGHMLHHSCWMEWFQTANNCPKCRQTTHSNLLIKMYFNMGDGDDMETLMNKIDSLNCELSCKSEDYKGALVRLKAARDENLKLETRILEIVRMNDGLKLTLEEANKKFAEKCQRQMDTLQRYSSQTMQLEMTKTELEKTKIALEEAKKAVAAAERTENTRSKSEVEMIRKYQRVVEGLKQCASEFDYMKKCKQLVQKLKIYTNDIDAAANVRLDVKKDPGKYVDMFKEVKKFWNYVEKKEETLNKELKRSPRGCVIHLTGFPSGRTDIFTGLLETRIKYHGGNVAWVTYSPGDAEAYIRLKRGLENNPAEVVVKKLGDSKNLRIKDFVVNASVLEGDEETKFLKRSLQDRDQKTKRFNNNEYECDDSNEVGKLDYFMSLVALV